MRQMRWSWHDLTGETGGIPLYVERYCTNFLSIRAHVQQQAMERAKREAERRG